MNNNDLVKLLLPIETNYVFGGSRYIPYDTDCSGIVCAAFFQVYGISPYTLGTWTGAQWSNDFLDFVWYGYTPNLPYESMYPGDVIFTSNVSADFSTGNGSHVGFYTGNPGAPFLSHFANGGPYITAVNGVYGNERYFGVKRYSKGIDDMEPVDVWAYKNKAMTNIDTYQELFDVHKQLTRTDTAGHDNPDGHDFFGRIQIIEKDVREIKEAIAKLQIGDVSIDYNELARIVADEFSNRMKN